MAKACGLTQPLTPHIPFICLPHLNEIPQRKSEVARMATLPPTTILNLIKVVISSSVINLPKHRQAAIDGVWRGDMRPVAMERDRLSLDRSPLKYSLELVDSARVYLGIFANRYGTCPQGYDESITVLEYRRAVDREMPILIFLNKDDVPVAPEDVEDDPEKRDKLKRNYSGKAGRE